MHNCRNIHIETKKKPELRKKNVYRLAPSLAGWLSVSFLPFFPVALFNVQTLPPPPPLVAQSPLTTPSTSPSLKSLLSPRPSPPSTPHSLQPHRIHSQPAREISKKPSWNPRTPSIRGQPRIRILQDELSGQESPIISAAKLRRRLGNRSTEETPW